MDRRNNLERAVSDWWTPPSDVTASRRFAVTLIVGAGAILAVAWAVSRWLKMRAISADGSAGGSTAGGSNSTTNGTSKPVNVPAMATQLASTFLMRTGQCEIKWADSGSQIALAGHVVDFFGPAVGWARANGAQGVEGVTGSIYGLFMPGCATRPKLIQSVDLDRALSNDLITPAQAAFNLTLNDPTVQLYLAIRAQVSALLQ